MKPLLKLDVLMLSTLLVVASAAVRAQTLSQDYPTKQIDIVLGFSAGGGTDTIARILAAKLSENLGVPVVVENKPGANGNIAAQQVASSRADGYTLLANTSSVILNPLLGMKQALDITALTPLSLTGITPYALVITMSLPPRDIREFVSYAKANNDKLRYASGGVGNMTHLANLLFLQATGIRALHIPYKGGTPAFTATISGEVQFYMGPVNNAATFIKNGRVKGLAVTSANRVALSETIIPGFEAGSWYGLMGPAKMPRAVVARLHSEIVKALHDSRVAAQMEKRSVQVKTSTPERYAAFLRDERAQWNRLIKSAGIEAK